MRITPNEEDDLQELLKNFPPLPEEKKVPRYWIGTVVIATIVAIGLTASFLSY
jgi:hypothetical protein